MRLPLAQEESKKKCIHCGNNPTSHMHARIDSSIFIALNPMTQKLLRTSLGRCIYRCVDYCIEGFLFLLLTFRAARFDSDPQCIISERGKVLAHEAHSRGLGMETLRVFGKVTDTYRLFHPSGKKFLFNGLPRIDVSNDATAGWIDDKVALKQCLRAEGIPVSRGDSFSDILHAEEFFNELQKPVIVKPRLGSRGRHTTTWLTDVDDFRKAFYVGKQLGRFVIVEEHLVGSVYRATVIGGELVAVLAGDPPRVIGDGVRTIRELILYKNETRHTRVSALSITEHMSTFLGQQKKTLDSVLSKGETIDLSEKIGLSYGGNSREVTPYVHAKLRNELERAARVVDDPLLGFDFISTDVSVDPDTVRWGIIECNAVPFINLHHDPLEGEPVNVAGKLLDYIDQQLAASRI